MFGAGAESLGAGTDRCREWTKAGLTTGSAAQLFTVAVGSLCIILSTTCTVAPCDCVKNVKTTECSCRTIVLVYSEKVGKKDESGDHLSGSLEDMMPRVSPAPHRTKVCGAISIIVV